ncbi:receptor-type adenylate cyclase, putative [Trypanosoma cruzi marinkellei]|uniref:Receptor-type adenylate cyclase, putative n=1 Tax=Trypanosoma cruzi marinkellei TaxID=85056 RepID=K2MD11_TRYCR|nr:receptor-type adenylate cyclase, putative [Trypanosoma cruzi marinkellei]
MEGFRAEDVVEGAFTLKLDECDASLIELRAPLYGLASMMQDGVVAQLAMGSMLVGVDDAKPSRDYYDGTTVTSHTLSTSAAGARDALLSEMSARRVHFVSGVVTVAMLDVEGVAFIDPLPLEPRLNRFQINVIRLSPTLEQQFFVLAEYLGSTSGGPAHAVIRSDGGCVAAVTVDVWRVAGVCDALVDHLPVEGDACVVGLSAGGAGGIAWHVASHGVVRVFFCVLGVCAAAH